MLSTFFCSLLGKSIMEGLILAELPVDLSFLLVMTMILQLMSMVWIL